MPKGVGYCASKILQEASSMPMNFILSVTYMPIFF